MMYCRISLFHDELKEGDNDELPGEETADDVEDDEALEGEK